MLLIQGWLKLAAGEFDKVADADRCTTLASAKRLTHNGRSLRAQKAHMQRSLVVGNRLSVPLSDARLQTLGELFGPVESTRTIVDNGGLLTAFGVVSFTYREDAIAAMRVECMCVWVAISMTLN